MGHDGRLFPPRFPWVQQQHSSALTPNNRSIQMTVTLKSQPWLCSKNLLFSLASLFSLILSLLPILSVCRLNAISSHTGDSVHNNRCDPCQWKESILWFGDTSVVCVHIHPDRHPSHLFSPPANRRSSSHYYSSIPSSLFQLPPVSTSDNIKKKEQ